MSSYTRSLKSVSEDIDTEIQIHIFPITHNICQEASCDLLSRPSSSCWDRREELRGRAGQSGGGVPGSRGDRSSPEEEEPPEQVPVVEPYKPGTQSAVLSLLPVPICVHPLAGCLI